MALPSTTLVHTNAFIRVKAALEDIEWHIVWIGYR